MYGMRRAALIKARVIQHSLYQFWKRKTDIKGVGVLTIGTYDGGLGNEVGLHVGHGRTF